MRDEPISRVRSRRPGVWVAVWLGLVGVIGVGLLASLGAPTAQERAAERLERLRAHKEALRAEQAAAERAAHARRARRAELVANPATRRSSAEEALTRQGLVERVRWLAALGDPVVEAVLKEGGVAVPSLEVTSELELREWLKVLWGFGREAQLRMGVALARAGLPEWEQRPRLMYGEVPRELLEALDVWLATPGDSQLEGVRLRLAELQKAALFAGLEQLQASGGQGGKGMQQARLVEWVREVPGRGPVGSEWKLDTSLGWLDGVRGHPSEQVLVVLGEVGLLAVEPGEELKVEAWLGWAEGACTQGRPGATPGERADSLRGLWRAECVAWALGEE